MSRLSWQKGIDLIFNVADKIIANGGYLIILGSGEKSLESRFEELRNRYPNKVGIYIGYSNEIAHKIYAGSDFYLMPSLFEPCGISQMIAKLYASIPIVRNVGGLKDTVNDYLGDNASSSDGIKFNDFNNEGYYVVFYFEANPNLIAELERIYRITDEVIKFMTIKVEE